jgi:hypothetical protein
MSAFDDDADCVGVVVVSMLVVSMLNVYKKNIYCVPVCPKPPAPRFVGVFMDTRVPVTASSFIKSSKAVEDTPFIS